MESQAVRAAILDAPLRYLYRDRDRHGNVRVYFWRGKGHPKVRVIEERGTPEFHEVYAKLLAGVELGGVKAPKLVLGKSKAQTFRWLCEVVFGLPEFQRELGERTQKIR